MCAVSTLLHTSQLTADIHVTGLFEITRFKSSLILILILILSLIVQSGHRQNSSL